MGAGGGVLEIDHLPHLGAGRSARPITHADDQPSVVDAHRHDYRDLRVATIAILDGVDARLGYRRAQIIGLVAADTKTRRDDTNRRHRHFLVAEYARDTQFYQSSFIGGHLRGSPVPR